MQTPAGKECEYYHEDFHRGRNTQECRLVKANPASLNWLPSDCFKCPVPDILAANASNYLELQITIQPRLLGFGRAMAVNAYCIRHKIEIENPFIGCTECNEERPGLDLFRKALEQEDDSD